MPENQTRFGNCEYAYTYTVNIDDSNLRNLLESMNITKFKTFAVENEAYFITNMTIQGLLIGLAVLVGIWLFYYSWTFGIKDRRFYNSWLLASFYFSSILNIF